MDEELAEFTDRILSGQSAEETTATITVDEALYPLENTVSQLKAAAKNPHPQATMQRIEKQLINEWHKNQSLAEKKSLARKNFWSGWRFWKNQPLPRLALAFALIAIFLIVILIFPVSQLITPNIQASAGGTNQYQLSLFIVAAILVISLLWFGRNKS